MTLTRFKFSNLNRWSGLNPRRDWLAILLAWLILLTAVIGWRTYEALIFQVEFEKMINPDFNTKTIKEDRLLRLAEIVGARAERLEELKLNPPATVNPAN
jgi:hypothetical protein